MPRGRRKKPDNYEEEIMLIDTQIADLMKKIRVLKDKKKIRIKEETENKDSNKWDLIKNSGLSVDQILAIVNEQKGSNT